MDPDEDRETQKEVGKGLERLPFLPWDGGEDGQLIVSPSLCGSIRFVPSYLTPEFYLLIEE